MGTERIRPSREALARLKSLNQMIETGGALLQEFELLGVQTLEELASANAKELYHRLCQAKGAQLDSSFETMIQRAVARAQEELAQQDALNGSAPASHKEQDIEKPLAPWPRH